MGNNLPRPCTSTDVSANTITITITPTTPPPSPPPPPLLLRYLHRTLPSQTAVAIVHANGFVEHLPRSDMTASDFIARHPGHFLSTHRRCPPRSPTASCRPHYNTHPHPPPAPPQPQPQPQLNIQALPDDACLKLGHVYFLLPRHMKNFAEVEAKAAAMAMAKAVAATRGMRTPLNVRREEEKAQLDEADKRRPAGLSLANRAAGGGEGGTRRETSQELIARIRSAVEEAERDRHERNQRMIMAMVKNGGTGSARVAPTPSSSWSSSRSWKPKLDAIHESPL